MKTKDHKSVVQLRIAAFLRITGILVISINTLLAQPVLEFNPIATNFRKPVDIKYSGDDTGKLFIVQQSGEVYIFDIQTKEKALFINIGPKIKLTGQKGLLGIAFDPNYTTTGRFFLYYNELHSSNITVERYQRNDSNHAIADPSSGVVLLSEQKPYSGGIHNGGCMHFGNDGFLYIGIGDGSPKGDPYNIAQDGNSLFGKILRLDVNTNESPYYSIPPDNPFINDPYVKDEIWATGLRNPWRFSFDRLTHDIWIGDVGQKYFEEIDFATPLQSATGLNFGWRCYEGNALYKPSGCLDSSSYMPPAFVYDHLVAISPKKDGAVIGGYVYRGNKYPQLQGWYICGDYMLGVIFTLKHDEENLLTSMQSNVPMFTSFGEDEHGEMYGVDYEGVLYEVTVPNIPPPTQANTSKFAISVVYPTVVNNNHITIQLKALFDYVTITDMNGHQVFSQKLPAVKMNTIQLSIPELATGMYVLQLAGKVTEQHKIMIQK